MQYIFDRILKINLCTLNNGPFSTFLTPNRSIINTVKFEIKAAFQKFVIPKEKALLCRFSIGITSFWGAAFISDFTVFENLRESVKSTELTPLVI